MAVDHENTLNDLFENAFKMYPDRVAISFYGKKITYRQLDYLAGQFAKFLKSRGIGYGERVALLLPNCPQLVIAYLGTLRVGGIMVALNPLSTTDEILEMVQQVKPSIFISLQDFRKHNYEVAQHPIFEGDMMVISLANYLPLGTGMLYWAKNFVGRLWHWVKNPKHIGFFPGPQWQDVEDSPPTKRRIKISPRDTAVLQFTGGTTGSVKAAELTHYNLVNNAKQSLAVLGDLVSENSVFFGALPLFHVYGLSVCLNIALSRGCTVVIPRPKSTPKQLVKTIMREQVSVLPSFPKIISSIITTGLPKESYRSLKVCFSGAGALDSKLKAEFQALTGAPIYEGYGLSETSPVVSVNTPGANKDGSLGKPVPDTEIKIVDEELFVRGPQVMKGYWRKQNETNVVLDREGWFATGDMVRMDEDNFPYLTDRKNDMVKVRGEKVFPSDIEKVIALHPKVQEVAVIGAPDRDLGERIVAFVVPKEGNLKVEEILAFCRKEGLTSNRMPQEIRFIKEIPKNQMLGKVLKKELRKMIIDNPSK